LTAIGERGRILVARIPEKKNHKDRVRFREEGLEGINQSGSSSSKSDPPRLREYLLMLWERRKGITGQIFSRTLSDHWFSRMEVWIGNSSLGPVKKNLPFRRRVTWGQKNRTPLRTAVEKDAERKSRERRVLLLSSSDTGLRHLLGGEKRRKAKS